MKYLFSIQNLMQNYSLYFLKVIGKITISCKKSPPFTKNKWRIELLSNNEIFIYFAFLK